MSSSSTNRILFVRNLPHSASHEELFELFGTYGPIRQLRLGTVSKTRGTCYVVYEELDDAKAAAGELSGFLFKSFYLKVGYFNPQRVLRELRDEQKALHRDELTQRIQKEIGTA
ncbi:hypothetical protein P9112_000317 [Eukaryota sp. TZLM1-RC]